MCVKPWLSRSTAPRSTTSCCSGKAKSRAGCSRNGSRGTPSCSRPPPDLARARSLVAGLPAASRTLSLAADDRAMADRIALNARDAGLIVSVVPAAAAADLRLAQARIVSASAAQALPAIAAALGLPSRPRAETPEALYAAERALLDGYRVIPLFHLPDTYAVSPRVKGGPGITPLGEWRFENLWLEGGRP